MLPLKLSNGSDMMEVRVNIADLLNKSASAATCTARDSSSSQCNFLERFLRLATNDIILWRLLCTFTDWR